MKKIRELENYLENFNLSSKNKYGDMYPLTIVADRYGGTYSGAYWLAFNLNTWEIHDGPWLDDISCVEFWEKADKSKIGFGNTPNEAYMDLLSKLKCFTFNI